MLDLTPDPASLDPIETASIEELRALQLDRLRWTLRHAHDHVPHYRQAFAEARVHPDDITSLADLARVPFTTKQDLRDAYPFGMFAVPTEQVARIHASSGTTGQPTVVGYTADDVDIWADVVARSLRAAGVRPGMRVHVAYGYGLFTGGLGVHYGAERLGCTVIPVSGGMTERQVQLITDFEPDAAQAQLPVHALEWSLLGCRMSECIHPEFDVPTAAPGVPAAEAVHHLESTILVRDLFSGADRPCDFESDANCVPLEMAPEGVALVYANFHCHPPACLDAGLWNDETGELICQVTAVYGQGDSAADDAGYHRVPPCVWGRTEDGLRPPPTLSLDARLRGSMRANSTYGQYGMMGIWMLRVGSASEVATWAE